MEISTIISRLNCKVRAFVKFGFEFKNGKRSINVTIREDGFDRWKWVFFRWEF